MADAGRTLFRVVLLGGLHLDVLLAAVADCFHRDKAAGSVDIDARETCDFYPL